MENRPPNPRGPRETMPPHEDYRAAPRGRREEPRGREREAYPPYRQEPPRAAPSALDEVLEGLAALQDKFVQIAANQVRKDDLQGLAQTLEDSFTRKLAAYYPAEMIDAKFQERTQLWQTTHSELEEIRQQAHGGRQDDQTFVRAFIHAFWVTWQARAVLISVLILAGIFGGVVLIDIFTLILHR